MNQALAQVFREHCPSTDSPADGRTTPASGIFGGAYESGGSPILTLDRDDSLRRCFQLYVRGGDADYEAFRAVLEALFDTFASAGN